LLLQEKLQEQTRIKFGVLDEKLPFEPYLKVIKVSAVPLDKDEVSEAESRGNIIEGYNKSVYPAYVFDSTQEKLLADSLEKDKTVISWVRLRTGQLPIRYIYGNYNPDFIVETPGVIKDSGKFLEFSMQDNIHLIDTVYYSDVVVWIVTSIGLDSLVFDKPQIAVDFDGPKKKPYWESIKRFNDEDHMRSFFKTGGIKKPAISTNLFF